MVVGPKSHDTHKGLVAHIKADRSSADHSATPLRAGLIVFPQYQSSAGVQVRPRTRAETFIFAAHHSFNYSVLGEAGFDTMTSLVDAVGCFDLRYGNLDGAIATLTEMHAEVSSL